MIDPVVTFTTDKRQGRDVAARIAQTPHWVAVEEGAILGFATYGPFRSGPGYARTFEHSVLLSPAARRRGLGRALMSQLETHLKAKGAHILVAGIGGENQAALAFHARLGFAEVARMPQVGRKAGRWQTLVLMQKALSEPDPGR